MPQNQLQVDDIFDEALRHSPGTDRERYLEEACAGDGQFRQRVERLLRAAGEAGSFLDAPAGVPPTTDQLSTIEKPGAQIGPYKLLQQLGEGGMGVVYMAEQKEPVRRRVALKIIKPGMDTSQVVARFEAERQALAMMDHPNIAKVLDAGATASGRPFFVMELVNGLPVTKYCDEQHLTLRERLGLFIPICQAVQHAHQKGIIHRDLKPTNILIALYDGRPVPKIIDFGVAKATTHTLTEKTMFTQLGQVVGTLEYMSPEQAERNQLDVDTRSDIYSLGVVLYELLTGETPIDRKRLRSAAFDEMLRMIREEEPSKPSTKISTSQALPSIASNRRIEPARLGNLVRGELDWIVMKALEKDRGRRYDTASAFAADVQHYLNDEAIVACPPSTAYRFRKFARKHQSLLLTACLIGTTLLVGAVASAWQAVRATRAEHFARENEKRALDSEAIALKAVEEERKAKEAEAEQRRKAVASEQHAVEAAQSERMAREAETQARRKAEAAEKSAAKEAATARAVSEFLRDDLLRFGNLYGQAECQIAPIAPDPNVRVVTLLERSIAIIDERFANQPDERNAVQETIAGAFLSLARYPEAYGLWKQVLSYNEANLGPNHPDTIQSMLYLAQACFPWPNAEARELREAALKRAEEEFGWEHPVTVFALNDCVLTYWQAREWEKALPLSTRLVELSLKVHGPKHRETLTALVNHATVLQGHGDWDDAIRISAQLVSAAETHLGRQHPKTVRFSTGRTALLRSAGRYGESVARQSTGITDLRHVYGDDHLETIVFCLACIDFCHWLETQQDILGGFTEAQRAELRGSRDLALAIKSLEVDFQHAAWLVRLGKQAEYEDFVRAVYRRSRTKETQRAKYLVARMAALSSHSPLPIEDLLALAEAAIDGSEGPTGFYLHTWGLALLRAGDFEKAVKQFQESSRLEWCTGLNDLASAIALSRLQRHDEARQAFDRGREWCRDAKIDSQQSVYHWHDRIAAQVLLREAEEVQKAAPGE